MVKQFDRKLVLEDGAEYFGYGFGDRSDKVTEIVFHTSMVGYQEIISDPACTDQTVVMTYPLIGNYGIVEEDLETRTPTIAGLVVREYNDSPSNFRYTRTLAEIMEENRIAGIYGVDTRALTRSIRDFGSRKALITDITTTKEEALKILKETALPRDQVARVSCKKKWYSRTPNPRFNVVALDLGIKLSHVRALNQCGANVTVVPYNTPVEEIKKMKPDGIFLSDGPGNPEDAESAVELVKKLKGKVPVFGVGLGYQALCLAYGAKTYKLKFGHRGGNHPVRELETGKIDIVTQGHSYAVDADSLKETGLKVTGVNVLDNVIEGVESKKDRVFGVQYQPETTPDIKGGTGLFAKFVALMKEGKENA
ncbi:MAG: glutamine-hydrolyzing carbamoyl-phosphate synthase small subunit [Clostridia bacterium]|nr:glutamine-hydrolyzing carbamoyl-phosphate synthase small subunit [Clostridia bacterium]